MLLALGVGASAYLVAAQPQGMSPEARAIAFLAGEVPRWPVENNCFSCHNNGDAARALYTAVGQDYAVEAEALRATTAWLQNPAAWDDNALGLEFADKTLARIQFAGALVDAMLADQIRDPVPLADAVALIAADQSDDGSWQIDTSGSIGSPATYGRVLATWAALRALKQADTPDLAPLIARAERWVRGVEVQSVIDAAAVILALEGADDTAAVAQRQRCLEDHGGAGSVWWLGRLSDVGRRAVRHRARRARAPAFARATGAGGSGHRGRHPERCGEGWPGVPARRAARRRQLAGDDPAGQQSYAQYISTTGWATLALLATR